LTAGATILRDILGVFHSPWIGAEFGRRWYSGSERFGDFVTAIVTNWIGIVLVRLTEVGQDCSFVLFQIGGFQHGET
jgi:hypothetical protein